MIETMWTISRPAGFGMPVSVRERVASVRDLPMTTGVVSVPAAGTIVLADDHGFQGTAVCGYRLTTDAVVATGLFPGTSAWSPPI